jgi:hypothetical protein
MQRARTAFQSRVKTAANYRAKRFGLRQLAAAFNLGKIKNL